MRLGPLDLSARVAVVAEIGNNHEGDLPTAHALVAAAADAGCDAVKLQALTAASLVGPGDAARTAQLRGYELGVEGYRALCRDARARGLAVGVTPLALGMVDALRGEVDFWKVASGDNDHLPLLRRLTRESAPVVMSAGASDLAGLRRALDALEGAGGVCVLHCVAAYPVPVEAAELAAIPALAGALGVTVGYSDHTLGVEAAPLAVALGARMIEKHITLDRGRTSFRDHALSADPAGMADLVDRVRRAEAMMGRGVIGVRACERSSLPGMRRAIAAARDLPAGAVIGPDDLTWLRPGTGLPPGEEGRLVGRMLGRDVPAGHPIVTEDLHA